MKITKAGQISVPAPIRKRWGSTDVRIQDCGDSFVVRPVPEDPVEAIFGIFKDKGKYSSEELRQMFRDEERSAEERKYGRMPDVPKRRKSKS